MKITTKTGDKGETNLFGGRRVSKASGIIALVGELDELQAVVGWCKVEWERAGEGRMGVDVDGIGPKIGVPNVHTNSGEKVLKRVVDDLYRIMSVVGFEFKCPGNIKMIDESDVEFLEEEMGKYEEEMNKVMAFVRPGEDGGSELSARLHIARTVCRRVERGMVENGGEGAILKYLNRLSDFLFVLAYRGL